MIPQEILEKIDQNRQRYVEELVSFLKIPSVSTYTQQAGDIRRAAEWVQAHLKRLGFQAKIYPTERHPIVFGSWCPHPGRPTLLIYGHYDVQPPEPLKEWVTDPFSPSIRNGYVYARGAADDKGQFFTYLKAIEAVLAVDHVLPVNVKVLVEGEEEIGSMHLPAFLKDHREELAADIVTISDGSQFKQGIPAITYGLRGLCYLQLEVQGAKFDLHSGSFGGIVPNPVHALSEMLVKLRNPDGSIAIPGFYDRVIPLDERERRDLATLPYDEEELKDYLGLKQLSPEACFTVVESRMARPTLDVNGIWGGFAGEGAKTIIPAKAGAKVSMRLIPDQDPSEISALFKAFIEAIQPPGCEVTVAELHGAAPVLVSREQQAVGAAERAIRMGFGKSPVYIREGGSIPIVNHFKEILGVGDILLLGWGSPDDGAHSPNERFNLDDFHKGIRSAAALFYELAPA